MVIGNLCLLKLIYSSQCLIRLNISSEKNDFGFHSIKLEDLTVLKRSPDLLSNVKIGQDQLQLILKHIWFYGGCRHFGHVT